MMAAGTVFREWRARCAAVLAMLLVACGGGGDDRSVQSASGIGPAGGTVTGPNGTQVVIPAGALATSTPIAITQSNTGAPPLPQGLVAFGTMYAFTPHGTSFAQPVTVTVPIDPASIPAGATPVLYKTNAQNQWEPVPGATLGVGSVSAQVTSFSFFLIGNQPPQITRQPSDVTVLQPNPATFTVTALGTPPFTYQWQRSDDGGATFTDVGGATSATYTTGATSATTDDGDRYRVLVGNLGGATTSQSARLTVTANVVPPTIDTQPQDVSVAVGGNATFTVVASGLSPQYQWERSNDGGATFADIAGATNASLTLTNVQSTDDNARFRARVFNLAGGVTSNAARLTVGATPPPPPAGAARIAAGGGFSLARNAAGTAVFSWGTDSGEALGNGSGGDRNVPGSIPLPGFVPQPAVAIATGSGARHGLMISDATAWAWGYNGFGQVGNGNTTSQPNLVPMTHDNGFVITGATAVAAGTLHSLVLRNDGRVFAVGSNAFGQLGDSTNTDRLRAVAVPNPTNVIAIAAGGQFSLALRGDGTVWAWGANANGQLGDGTQTDRNTPVLVPGLSGVTAIAAGSEHALALLATGAVVAWGLNSEGQLGDNTTVNRLSPVPVIGFARAFAIAAGGNNSAAVGEVFFVWGSNGNGQLGTGSTSPAFRAVAGQVSGLSGPVFGFAVGGNHMLALRPDGTVLGWGANDSGQIGNGATGGNVLTPVQVTGLNLN
jgi:alpha-tubulin suppressor-like RCC1 family protein